MRPCSLSLPLRKMRDTTTDGLLLVHKPAGVTSHDIVLAARRAFGESRIGHAGTLDPFATGLLVLLLGRATRLLPHLDGIPKEYDATIAFGRETDTDDIEGATVREALAPDDEAVGNAIRMLTGDLAQIPPAYSAKRIAGRRAYEAARVGELLDLAPASVHVYEWRKIERHGDLLSAVISCGSGTYIRSLARDLGRLTGSAAHLVALRRNRSGPFHLRDAITLETLRSGAATIRPALDVLPTIPHVTIQAEEAERVLRGMSIERDGDAPRAALIDVRSGALVAFAEGDAQRWQPRVVMRKVD